MDYNFGSCSKLTEMDCRVQLTNFGVEQPLIRALIDDLTGSRPLQKEMEEIKIQIHVAE